MINILNLALPIVSVVHPNVTVTCKRYDGHSVSDAGRINPTFTTFTARGQFQYQHSQASGQQEMEIAKISVNMWIKAELHTVETQKVADQVVFEGRTYNVVGVDHWNPGNGWGSYSLSLDKVASGM